MKIMFNSVKSQAERESRRVKKRAKENDWHIRFAWFPMVFENAQHEKAFIWLELFEKKFEDWKKFRLARMTIDGKEYRCDIQRWSDYYWDT